MDMNFGIELQKNFYKVTILFCNKFCYFNNIKFPHKLSEC